MAIKLHYRIRYNPFISPKRKISLIKLVFIIFMITIAGSGCAFSRYKLVKKVTPPIKMNLNLSQPPIEVLLYTVIIYKGPGSWRREAYWDEYIVSIGNRGNFPLTIESAALIDFQDKHNIAGSDPWKLEKQSKAWWKRTQTSGAGTAVVLGAGTGVSLAVFGASFGIMGAGSVGGMAIGAAGVVAMPVVGVSYIVGNIRGRHKIEKEFERRRLVLPITIPTGQVVQGSLFFPITAGPKRLVLHYQMDEEEYDKEFDLSPLKSLHIKDDKLRKKYNIQILKRIDAGHKDRSIAKELGIEVFLIRKEKNEAIKEGLMTREGKLTELGQEYVSVNSED